VVAYSAQLAVNLPYTWHPEVWVLVGFLVGAFVYMVRVIGPKAVAPGQPVVSRLNVVAFVLAMLTLWIASDWPVHDISEDFLYSVHMVQHMALTYFVPPLALMATPTWLARLLIGDGRVYRALKWLTHPVVAAVVFNASIMILHIPLLVNESVQNGPLHYLLHFLVVMTALLMWSVVCGPIPEFRIGSGGAMIYLFAQSIIPTVPAAWLVFAENPVYKAYDRPDRLWGINVIDDQQLAGAIMKVAGGLYLWGIVIYLFATKFAANQGDDYDFRRKGTIPTEEITGHDERPLTTQDVERAFAETAPPSEP
jgi:putative membrane protein